MAESCSTEIESTILLHSWTVKNFSNLRADMMLRSTVFSGVSTYTANPVSWYYELNPSKSVQGVGDCMMIEAYAVSTHVPRSRLHAEIILECNSGNITNPKCSGTIEAGAQIGGSMRLLRTSVNSYLVKDGTLTLGFKLTLFEEIRDGIPQQRLAFLPDVLLLDHFAALLACDKFSDVTFVIGEDRFCAHKAILAVRSPVFAAMFDHDMQESKENTVKITDIRPEVFREALRFIYTGSAEKIELLADELLIAAEKYALDNLKRMCEDHLAMVLTVELSTEMLRLADTYNANQLKQQTIDFISANLKEMKPADWKSLIAANVDVAAEMIAKMAVTK